MNADPATATSKKIITDRSDCYTEGRDARIGSWFRRGVSDHRHHAIAGGFLYVPKFPDDKKHKENTARCFVK